jgi:hypothetical protein
VGGWGGGRRGGWEGRQRERRLPTDSDACASAIRARRSAPADRLTDRVRRSAPAPPLSTGWPAPAPCLPLRPASDARGLPPRRPCVCARVRVCARVCAPAHARAHARVCVRVCVRVRVRVCVRIHSGRLCHVRPGLVLLVTVTGDTRFRRPAASTAVRVALLSSRARHHPPRS